MIRKLLLLLVVITILQNIAFGQGAELYGNAFWQSANNRVVVRIALRNPTGSSTGQMKFVGMRFGFQYNAAQVTYAGYTSHMTGLNDPGFIDFIGPDTAPNAADIDASVGSSRTATVSTGGTKTMQQRYIARSTNVCDNAMLIPAGSMAILLDIYFTLNTRLPSYYHLTDPDYGFGDTEFIAQFLHKFNGGHTGALSDAYKDIAIVAIRQGNSGNPYQPFDASSCTNENFSPITIGSDDISFITPINGVLTGKVIDASLSEKDNNVLVGWKSEHNQLIDYFEVQRNENGGEFKTIGFVMSSDNPSTEKYEFKDKITIRDIESTYRIKVINRDKIITYSDVKKIRLSSEQSVTVKVFPNPSSESLRINLPVSNGVFVCRMYSAEGRMVQVSNVSAANPTVNIKTLQAGSYFMELYQPQTGKRYYTQFSKQ